MNNDPERLTDQELFADMSKGDLKDLGLGDVAYVKRYATEGQAAFILYAADGTALSIQKNETSAARTAYNHDLELVAVH